MAKRGVKPVLTVPLMSKKIAGPEIERLVQFAGAAAGLGPRSARKAALGLLKKRQELLVPLSDALRTAVEKISECPTCGNLDTVSRARYVRIPDANCPLSWWWRKSETFGPWNGQGSLMHGIMFSRHLSPLDGIGRNNSTSGRSSSGRRHRK